MGLRWGALRDCIESDGEHWAEGERFRGGCLDRIALRAGCRDGLVKVGGARELG